MSRLTLVVAATLTNGIGQNGTLPWRLPKELSHFARVTTTAPEGSMNVVLMGRNTWESIPPKFRPLPKRMNIVVSGNEKYQLMPPDATTPCVPVHLHSSLDAALGRLANTEWLEIPIHRSFIIGGASVYRDTLALPPTAPSYVDRLLLTRILSPAFEGCDTFMPEFLSDGKKSTAGEVDQVRWRKASHEEYREWAGVEVAEGVQEENGVQYEFQMWVR